MAHYLLATPRHFELNHYRARGSRLMRRLTDEVVDPEGGIPLPKPTAWKSGERDLLWAVLSDAFNIMAAYPVAWEKWTKLHWGTRAEYLEAIAWAFGPPTHGILDFETLLDAFELDYQRLRTGMLVHFGRPGPALTVPVLQDRHEAEIRGALELGACSWRRQGSWKKNEAPGKETVAA